MSLADSVVDYYAALAPVYDKTAGYADPEAERLRVPIKARYQQLFTGRTVLEIACGTGYWTLSIAEAAESVLGVDVNPSLLAQARARCRRLSNVSFQIADAYTLDGIPAGFSGAFAHWWWSHIPLERLSAFVTALHSRLRSGAVVLFVDQLPWVGQTRRKDARGNTIEQRSLPDGRLFAIVKNFPSEIDVRNALAGMADNVEYVKRPEEGSWTVTYNVRTDSPTSSSKGRR